MTNTLAYTQSASRHVGQHNKYQHAGQV